MKALRNILGFTLIVIILSGLGYIGWFMSKETNISWSSIMGTKTASTVHTQHTEVQQSQSSSSTDVNPLDVLQGKVTSSYKSIQQVVESMSAYPYAGSANVATTNVNEATGNMDSIHSIDPSQLQHFQRGLYTLSEGVFLLNQLNLNLEEKARWTEASTPTYQVYANRHNLLVQDKAVLSGVYQKLSDAKELFLSNLSGNAEGVYIAAVDVQQANKAIYQMAQAVMELDSANQWVDNQIKQTMVQAQTLQASETMKMENAANDAAASQSSGFSIGSISMSTLITMFTILFVVLMLVGVIGGIRSQIVTQPHLVEDEQTI